MLIDLGLADMVAGAEFMPNQQGPTERRLGAVIAWRKPGSVGFGYDPEKQTWIPAVANGPDGEGRGRYWVGFWNDSPPTPEDSQRPYAHAGPLVELGDGNSWRIPEIDQLPHDYIRNDDGTWRFEIQRQYHDLWLESQDWIARVFDKENRPDLIDVLNYCEKILRQNYRLLPEVVSHLRLLNSENLAKVLHSCLGLLKTDE